MGSSRKSSRQDYDEAIRIALLEDDADRHEAEVAGLRSAITRLTYSIVGATGTLVVGIILWALNTQVVT